MVPYIDIGPWTLTTYSLSHAAGVTVAALLSYRGLRRIGLSSLGALGMILFLFLTAHVTAHLYHVIAHRAMYLTNPRGLYNFWNRGLALHGGLTGAGLGLLLAAKLSGRSPWQLADAFAPPAALALFFFRLGCYGRGCCYGIPCGEGSIFSGLSVKLISNMEVSVHPTQLYSAAATLVLFVLLLALNRKKLFQGELSIAFLLFYPVQRFLVEFLRAPPRGESPVQVFFLELNTNQLFALAFFSLGIVLLTLRQREIRNGIAARSPKKTGEK